MSLEQVVVPVVYGQQVPEESLPPSLPAAPAGSVSDLPGSSPAADSLPVADGSDLDPAPDPASGAEGDGSGFTVRLDNFTGPFDLLLQLIGKHKLDVTEIALHTVTDDFIAYIRAMGDDWDLEETSEFLLVAATLLDLKAARLLPAADVEDEEDLALLEARDLLFARLLQYKAYKEAAAFISTLEESGAKRWPRAVSMEQRYAEALPELVLGIGPERLFKLALKQFTPKPGPPEVSIAHIHQVRVSVPEHANLLRERLRRAGSATFSLLVADCENTLEVVARFLALLELYRQNLVDFEQPVSLDELTVRWIGGDDSAVEIEVDDYEGTPAAPEAPPAESVSDADMEDLGRAARHDPDDEDLDEDLDDEGLDDEGLGMRVGDAGDGDLDSDGLDSDGLDDSDLSDGEPDSGGVGDPRDLRDLGDESEIGDGPESGGPGDGETGGSGDGIAGIRGATLSDSGSLDADTIDQPEGRADRGRDENDAVAGADAAAVEERQ